MKLNHYITPFFCYLFRECKMLFISLFILLILSSQLFANNQSEIQDKISVTSTHPIRIVCIGNSITQGKSLTPNVTVPATFGTITDQLSYRFWLWQSLDSLGLNVDFVGTNHIWFQEVGSLAVTTPVSAYTGHTFPRSHEAFYGIKTAGFVSGTTSDNIVYPPFSTRSKNFTADIALIHLGTNDNDVDSVQTRENIYTVIDLLRAQHDSIIIILAKTITGWKAVNKLVDRVCVAKGTAKSPVIPIDLATGFINDNLAYGTMTWDWVHPNQKGQKFMAKRWYDKILSSLNTVTFELKNNNGDKIENAKIDFNNQTYYTDVNGVALFRGILPNSRLDYTVTVAGYNGASGSINVTTNYNKNITLQNTTRLDTPSAREMQIFPNPASGLVTFSANKNTSVDIFDVSGKMVYSFALNAASMSVDLSKLGSGVYLGKYHDVEQSFFKKLIIK